MDLSRRDAALLLATATIAGAAVSSASASEPTGPAGAVDAALIQLACHDISARYAHILGKGNYEALSGIFSADGVLDVLGQHHSGAEAIIASFKSNPGLSQPGERVRHVITNEVIEVLGPASARGSAFFTIYRFNTLHGPTVPSLSPAALATSEDSYVLTPEGWRLALRRIHLEGAVAR